MNAIGFGQLFNGLVFSIGQLLEPGIGTNDRLDQAFVANSLGRILAIDNGGTIGWLGGPRNPDLPFGVILLRIRKIN